MANWIIVTGITAVYLAVTLWIGLRARGGAEQHSSLEDYVTGGRSFGLMLMFFIMGAEVFSAAAFLGNPGWAYGRGAPAFYLIAYVGLMASMGWLLAPRIRRIAVRVKHLTQADMLAGRFNSKTLAALIGLLPDRPYRWWAPGSCSAPPPRAACRSGWVRWWPRSSSWPTSTPAACAA